MVVDRVGSTPTPGTIFGSLAEWVKVVVLKTIFLTSQIVIPVKGFDSEAYFIIYDKNDLNKKQVFLTASEGTFVINETDNGDTEYRLVFDENKAVEIRPVKAYKKFFMITENGILVSRRTNAVLSKVLSSSGYYTHCTKIGGRNGKSVLLRIHRCVAEAFVENPNKKPFVNHIDGLKTNNDKTNLEWVTNQENVQHAYDTGLATALGGVDHPASKFTSQDLWAIKKLKFEQRFSNRRIARLYNVSHSIISDVINGVSYR